jgi:formylglycine-generating enzyme
MRFRTALWWSLAVCLVVGVAAGILGPGSTMIAAIFRTSELVPDANEPALLIAPFDAVRAGHERDLWAKKLGIPAEVTLSSLGLKLILIPPGQFEMGSPESPAQLQKVFPYAIKEWLTGELPVHRVTISHPIYIARCEVTKEQYQRFVDETGYRTDAETNGKGGWGFTGDLNKPWEMRPSFNWRSSGMEQRDDFPVVNMSWRDAAAFCRWLSKKEGKQFRLPTEAEYEYACRAGTTTRYYNGDEPELLTQIANVWDAASKRVISTAKNNLNSSDGWPFAAPVGQFAPNNFGLYDMLGNANEWCMDWYDENYYANSPETDPPGPKPGVKKIIRGGGWGLFAGSCRAADRHFELPTYCDADLGFRIVYVP